ncbi:MAG: hypothetical protein J0L70_16115 [Leptolyngbya sp. UWPOB_LEPTO1]|uniref:hypothetical protein n=1 Tax=Leptolyngbya sp. UWPOB_LEPTO1 TaxID=2815653 RepID=UPI001AC20337|nr:hypothetical protein [Leptolyngbya sp. UWPOB_LEPTO1]MBN8562055.1 hypothetical protein [Leptolyngbya sp. UWPOB_LEPTO1]
MKVIAYFLFGDDRLYEVELAFSVLSALRFLKDQPEEIKFCIVSDSAESLLQHGDIGIDLPIERLTFSSQELAAWTNNGMYLYRAKPFALKKVLEHYQAPAALIDTDTYFIDHPRKLFERIAPGCSVMHVREAAIGESELWQPIVNQIGSGINIGGIQISARSSMINSGVIGIDPADQLLIESAVKVLDHLYQFAPLTTVEQFSIGAVLEQTTQLSFSDDLIEHYWGTQKDFIRVQLLKVLKENTIANVNRILERRPVFPSIYPRIRFRDRIVTTWGFLQHRNHHYRRAQLAYRTALFYADRDPDYANAWAYTALQSLRYSQQRDRQKNARAFRFLNKDEIEQVSWIEPSTRRGWMRFWQQSG